MSVSKSNSSESGRCWGALKLRPNAVVEQAYGTAIKKGDLNKFDDTTIASTSRLVLAVIDGPYDTFTLSNILAEGPLSLRRQTCNTTPKSACKHGTFIMGLLGARANAAIPGLCPDCRLIHFSLFKDEGEPKSSVQVLAHAINRVVAAGAKLINLSLAVVSHNAVYDDFLAEALRFAEEKGVIVVAAAGNDQSVISHQLLSHNVTIPVVATDAAHRPLAGSNLTREILRRGLRACGHQLLGYAAGGGTTTMSGTSVAAAVASAILAQVWQQNLSLTGSQIRQAVSQLPSRDGVLPPIAECESILRNLERGGTSVRVDAYGIERLADYVQPQGEGVMTEPPYINMQESRHPTRVSVRPANEGATECTLGQACSCRASQIGESGLVYAIGTVEANYPNVGVQREMQGLAAYYKTKDPALDLDPEIKDTDDRSWQYKVLSHDLDQTRHIARQLVWRFTVENYPAYVIRPRTYLDFDRLVHFLEPGEGIPRTQKKKTTADKARPRFDHHVIIGSLWPAGMEVEQNEVFMDHIFDASPDLVKASSLGGGYFQQLSDNFGLTDEERAYNYLMARYPIREVIQETSELKGYELAGVPALQSRLGGAKRRIVRVIYAFTKAGNGLLAKKRFFVRVDVTDLFPFVCTPWHPYLERGDMP